jgi:hypothetical protein
MLINIIKTGGDAEANNKDQEEDQDDIVPEHGQHGASTEPRHSDDRLLARPAQQFDLFSPEAKAAAAKKREERDQLKKQEDLQEEQRVRSQQVDLFSPEVRAAAAKKRAERKKLKAKERQRERLDGIRRVALQRATRLHGKLVLETRHSLG